MQRRSVTRVCGTGLSAGLLVLLLPQLLVAQPAPEFRPQYPIGIEGIKGASVPPPGFYLRNYVVGYYSDDLPDGPSNFKLGAFIEAPRPIWITGLKILGADYGMSMIIPFGYQSVEAGPVIDEEEWGIGDIAVEPLILAWHQPRFDIGAGYAFWAPTGDYKSTGVPNPAKLGKGYWDHMFTLGATVFADEEKTWSASLLSRYEIPMEHEEVDGITPGQALSLEWGFAKTLFGVLDVGIIGYYQRQITKDTGSGASDNKDWVVGLGPEANWFHPKIGLFTSFRYVYELDAEYRPEGHTFVLTLTKAF